MVKIILKLRSLRRDDEPPQETTTTTTTAARGGGGGGGGIDVYVPRKPRSERKWKKMIMKNKACKKQRRRSSIINVPEEEEKVREKIARIKYSRDYSFLLPVVGDHDQPIKLIRPPPALLVGPFKNSKEALKSNVIKTSSSDDQKMGLKETLLDVIDSIADRIKEEDNECFRQQQRSCMPTAGLMMIRRPKISLGGPRLLIR
ncbi:hypothetical protein ACOSP7_014835 [Xanthoceras sorbifolium]|uniref:Uncharacterized protein n=1 Tax=Xanthoceras sorbifolium TaxID=99658 RepID=A0ABQ8I5L9_9ROSI|nr:hypothetical protein JRO89_XS04G0168500 [Xanthoceras sorbifolium]